MNSKAMAVPKCAPVSTGGEQQDDHRAGQQGGQDRKKDGLADHAHAPVEDADLGDHPVMFFAAAGEHARLQIAGAVDDTRQTAGADVEEGTDPGKQEHRRHRQLNDLRNLGSGRWERSGEHQAALDGAAIRARSSRFPAAGSR